MIRILLEILNLRYMSHDNGKKTVNLQNLWYILTISDKIL